MWNILPFDELRVVSEVEPPEAGNCPYRFVMLRRAKHLLEEIVAPFGLAMTGGVICVAAHRLKTVVWMRDCSYINRMLRRHPVFVKELAAAQR